MKPDVMDTVSNGILLRQAEQLEQAELTCSLGSQDDHSFLVVEEIEKQIQADLLIRRQALRTVTWDVSKDEVSCSCNGIVYRGMPCIHIAFIAQYKDYQIPLNIFNTRFHCSHPAVRLVQPVQRASPPPPSSEQPSHPSGPSDDLRYEVVPVSGPELHITEAYMNAHFGDEKSIRLRGKVRALEVFLLKEVSPFTTEDDLDETINKLMRELKLKADTLQEGRREQQVLVPHATRPNRKTSYITVPQQVARAAGEEIEMQRREMERRKRDLPMQGASPQVNKRSRLEKENEGRE